PRRVAGREGRDGDRRVLPGLKPDRGAHLAALQQHRHLGVEGLGDPLETALAGLGLVVKAGDQRQELGEAPRGPDLRLPGHQPTAKTTSVWLWNPEMPRVRAISP